MHCNGYLWFYFSQNVKCSQITSHQHTINTFIYHSPVTVFTCESRISIQWKFSDCTQRSTFLTNWHSTQLNLLHVYCYILLMIIGIVCFVIHSVWITVMFVFVLPNQLWFSYYFVIVLHFTFQKRKNKINRNEKLHVIFFVWLCLVICRHGKSNHAPLIHHIQNKYNLSRIHIHKTFMINKWKLSEWMQSFRRSLWLVF